MAKAIIPRPEPQPAPARRRRKEETQGGLIMAARAFMRHILRRQFRNAATASSQQAALPVSAQDFPVSVYAATAYLSDTLEWLNLWEQNADRGFDEQFQPVQSDHLYPHL